MSAMTWRSLRVIAAIPDPAEASPPHFRHRPDLAFMEFRFSAMASARASRMAVSWRRISPEWISP